MTSSISHNMLPKDLKQAELDLVRSLLSYIDKNSNYRISASLKFEGLRIMPIVARLSQLLSDNNIKNILLWADEGGAALARNQNESLKESIYSFNSFEKILEDRIDTHKGLLIIVSPEAYDYLQLENICKLYNSSCLLINPRLEDPNVGIGSVARSRRKKFINSFENIYWLEPIANGAIMHLYPHDWDLYKQVDNGYIYLSSFDRHPDKEEIYELFTQI